MRGGLGMSYKVHQRVTAVVGHLGLHEVLTAVWQYSIGDRENLLGAASIARARGATADCRLRRRMKRSGFGKDKLQQQHGQDLVDENQ